MGPTRMHISDGSAMPLRGPFESAVVVPTLVRSSMRPVAYRLLLFRISTPSRLRATRTVSA